MEDFTPIVLSGLCLSGSTTRARWVEAWNGALLGLGGFGGWSCDEERACLVAGAEFCNAEQLCRGLVL